MSIEALRAQIVASIASGQAALALLDSMIVEEEPGQAYQPLSSLREPAASGGAPPAEPPVPTDCKHKRREPYSGFGQAKRDICIDCRAVLPGR